MAVKCATLDAQGPSATGNASYTIAGFGAVKSYIVWATSAVTAGTDAAHCSLSTGYSDGTRQQSGTSASEDGVGTSNALEQADSDQVVRLLDGTSGTTDALATHNAFVTDGVELNWSNVHTDLIRLHFVFFGGDDLTTAVDTVTHGGASGSTVDHTQLGVRPDLVLFAFQFRRDAAANSDAYYQLAAAYDNGAGEDAGYIGVFNNDGDVSNTANTEVREDNRISSRFAEDPGVSTIELHMNTFLSTGWQSRKEGDFTYRLQYLALEGGGVNRMFADLITSPSSGTGNKAITGIGFKPQLVIICSSLSTSADVFNSGLGSGGISGSMAVGMFDDTRESSWCLKCQDGVTTMNNSMVWNTKALFHVRPNDTVEYDATFVSFDSDGFTLNFATNATPAAKWVVIAIEEDAAAALALRDPMMAPGIVPFAR